MVAVVKHGILEPKGDEVGVLGEGGPMLISETEPDKYSAHAGRKGPPTTGSQAEQGVLMGLERGGVL